MFDYIFLQILLKQNLKGLKGKNMNGKNIKIFLVDILLLIIFCAILLFNDYQSKKNLIENTKETQVYATVINKYTNIIINIIMY